MVVPMMDAIRESLLTLEGQVVEESPGTETEIIEGEVEAAAMIVVDLEVTVATEGGLDQDPGQGPDPVTGDPETDLTPGTEDPLEETEAALAVEDLAQKAEADLAKMIIFVFV